MNLKNCFTAKLKISNMKKNVTKELETLFSKVEPVQLAAAIFDLMAKHQALMAHYINCLLYTSPSPRDRTRYRMTSSA